MKKLSLLLLACAGLSLLSPTGAQAQVKPDDSARALELTPRVPLGKTWTPEQIKQLQTIELDRRALSLRERLTESGFTDLAVQDAIVDFYKNKEVARVKLQARWDDLQKALSRPEVLGAELSTLLNDFQSAADIEKARRETAFKELSTKAGLDQNLRLRLLLLQWGIPGDETSLLARPNNETSTTSPTRDLRRYLPIIPDTQDVAPNKNSVIVQTPVGPVRLDLGFLH